MEKGNEQTPKREPVDEYEGLRGYVSGDQWVDDAIAACLRDIEELRAALEWISSVACGESQSLNRIFIHAHAALKRERPLPTCEHCKDTGVLMLPAFQVEISRYQPFEFLACGCRPIDKQTIDELNRGYELGI